MRSPFLLALAATSALAVHSNTLFNFTSGIDIENSELRPNGHLLLTTFEKGRLYNLNPYANNPKAELIASLPGATALCGITTIAYDKYAVIGGVRGSYHYDNETIYAVDLSQGASQPIIQKVAHLPDAIMLNGMAALPKQPHVVLVGDAVLGVLFRVDTTTGAYKVAFNNTALVSPSTSSLPIGVNGLKIVENDVYFTNSAGGTFAKVPVSDDGQTFGAVKVIATMDTSIGDWDDFIVDSNGVGYLAQPTLGVAQVFPNGTHSIYASGISSATSVQISKDGYAYVTQSTGLVDRFKLPLNTTVAEGEV
ncbi:uncharacterized protein N7484_003655 [Penicillium longicatenatum]|uniref:uncharacterized protein n=1 Tax=Penicillium longicatenatum TaxID=1561947 RepID=UPI002548BE53|nr:uncharacterized protein N7484_003655 [Penicillium longicatenatum]KAJ5649932.1 hypothetical protein N7484_003655 [Penicillium longicatenatum]